MRSVRALAHLILALAVLWAPVARACAVGIAPLAAAEPHGDHHGDHRSPAADAGHACAGPSGEHPGHERDACRMACCVLPAQRPLQAASASAAAFQAVRYAAVAQAPSGRVPTPDPGVPKPLS